VLTGTVLSGSVKPQMGIVVPQLGEAGKGKKVRSLQMFKQPVQEAIQGDRVAMCVAALDAKELERGIVHGEKFPIPMLDAVVCVIDKISYFKSKVLTKAKYHITLGHQTVMATAHFFSPLEGLINASPSSSSARPPTVQVTTGDKAKASGGPTLSMGCGAAVADRQKQWPTSFDFSSDYLHIDELWEPQAPLEYINEDGDVIKLGASETSGRLTLELNGVTKEDVTELSFHAGSGRLLQQEGLPLATSTESRSVVPLKDRDRVLYLLKWLAQRCGVPGLPPVEREPLAYVLLVLEKPVMCPLGSLVIGSKLDFDTNSPNCRMAFFGRILTSMSPKDLKPLRLLKMKQKVGLLDRVDQQDPSLLICKEMFKADTDMTLFTGMKIVHENSGEEGVIEGTYGQEGKFKLRFKNALPNINTDVKGNVKGDEKIALFFKRMDFDPTRNITQ